MKTNSPIIGYGLIITGCAWAIAAVVTGLQYQEKSFLIFSFLAVLALLSTISGVIIAARLLPEPKSALRARSPEDKRIATFIHLAGLLGYIIPLSNIVVPFFIWKTQQNRSRFIYHAGVQAINFQLTCSVYFLSAFMLCALFIGFVMLPVIMLYHVLFTLIATFNAINKKSYSYPGNLNFIADKFDEKLT